LCAGKKQSRKWENCMTLDKKSWGFRREAKLGDYLTIKELLTTLAETVRYERRRKRENLELRNFIGL
jgi:hypothetical protein